MVAASGTRPPRLPGRFGTLTPPAFDNTRRRCDNLWSDITTGRGGCPEDADQPATSEWQGGECSGPARRGDDEKLHDATALLHSHRLGPILADRRPHTTGSSTTVTAICWPRPASDWWLSPDPERCLRAVLRRCGLALVRAVNKEHLVVRHWSGPTPDLRGWAKDTGWNRRGVQVVFVQEKTGKAIVHEDGQVVLMYGEPVGSTFPWGV